MEKEKISKSLDLLLKNKFGCSDEKLSLSLIHISEPTRP